MMDAIRMSCGAARFGQEYWLYVVYHCETERPQLVVVQDPDATLTIHEQNASMARHRVNAGEIQIHGNMVGGP
jgi:hypothetical protein